MNLTKIADGLRLIADGLDEAGAEDKPRKPAGKKTPAKKPADKKPDPEPTITKDQVMAAMQPIAAKLGAKGVKALLLEFNVARVSDLPATDYAAAVTLAEAKLKSLDDDEGFE